MTPRKEQTNTAAVQPTNTSTKESTRRRRRHWYDHEKIRIIEAYDKGELEPVYSKPNCVIDPKSKDEVSIFLIEGWKDQFRTLGIIKGTARQQPIVNTQKMPQSADAMQTLLVNVLLENQKLKSILETKSKKSSGKDQASASL